jgi:hypothetical protein
MSSRGRYHIRTDLISRALFFFSHVYDPDHELWSVATFMLPTPAMTFLDDVRSD